MEDIVKFSRLLRENNIPASLRSTQTAVKTFKLFKNDENSLNDALASVYVKDNQQRTKFDKIFKSVFEGVDEDEGESDGKEGPPSTKSNKNKRFLNGYNYSFKILNPQKFNAQISESDVTDYRPPLDEYINHEMDESELLKKDINHLTTFEPELVDLCQKL